MAEIKLVLNKNKTDSKDTKKEESNNNVNEDIMSLKRKTLSIEDLLIFTTEHNCSDLYIKVFEQPYISRFGKITRVPCTAITKDIWQTFYDKYILNELNAGYVRQKLLDTSVAIRVPENSPNYGKYPNNMYRYRVSFGFSEEKNVATFRMIKPEQPTFETINYNPKCVEALRKAYSKPSGICYATGPTGSGKALEKNTKIPTISGMKTLEDIKINDIIFDKNGQPTKVTGKYHPNDEKFYRFTFNDGTIVDSADGHLWEVVMLNLWNKKPYTEQFIKMFNNNILYYLQANTDNHIIVDYKCVYNMIYKNYCTYGDLKYFIGLLHVNPVDLKNLAYISVKLLLDTSTSSKRTYRLQNCDKEYITNSEAKYILKSKFIQIIKDAGISYISEDKPYVYLDELCKASLTYYKDISDKLESCGSNVNAILTTHDIVANGLMNNANRINFAIIKNKPCQYNSTNSNKNYYSFGSWLGHKYLLNQLIDSSYLSNDYKILPIQDKIDLISGLLDSIGIIDDLGNCTISLNVKSIITDLKEICCSLGFNCSKINTNIINYRNIYSFSFYPTLELSLQVEEKRNKLLNNNNENKFYLTDIKEIEGKNEDYYCLSVDSDTHTFLCTESYLPTHNSTTMAACINTFTKPGELLDNKVFITLEDPIENIFSNTDSVKISQKELGKDFLSFGLGIKAALREHPNIIIVGECRDKEVICAAIEAARTGHVTSTTFHASDVAGTINRLLYHLDNDKNLSLDLILQLNIILSQKMLKSNGKYLVDTQFMLFDDEVTKRLVDLLDDPDANLSKEINDMIHDPDLQERGLVKDWDYKELH